MQTFFLQRQGNQPLSPQHQNLGGAERDRTADPLLAKQVLSQLSYSPIQVSIPDRKPPDRSKAPRPEGTARPELERRSRDSVRTEDGGPGQTRTADLTLIRRAL